MSTREKGESAVPSWDGSSKAWRRYVKEITWYVGSTKVEHRQYVASKLISRLSGSARLLAMSWRQRDFEGPDGVNLLLRRFASSPLVRRSLPNAAAIMSEYFSFRRRQGEGISQFLVRESLGFEEFSEALIQLKEEKEGLDPTQRDFDLPDMSPKTDSWRDHQRWRNWQPPDDEDVSIPDDGRPTARGDGYDRVPTADPDGGSPSARGRTIPTRPPTPSDAGQRDDPHHVLGPLDSFILEVLRGWRLLVAAALSQDEWRDVLAATGNRLDYLSISSALQTLWDEQMGASKTFAPPPRNLMYNNWHEQQIGLGEDPNEWGEPWEDDDWYGWSTYLPETTMGDLAAAQDGMMPDDTLDPNDPDLQEALEAEKQAEALMSEARRTWSQAQQATALLRKDRGFGKAMGSSASSSDNRGCYHCGSH